MGTPPLHLHLPLATSTPEEARLRVSAGDKQRVLLQRGNIEDDLYREGGAHVGHQQVSAL